MTFPESGYDDGMVEQDLHSASYLPGVFPVLHQFLFHGLLQILAFAECPTQW